MVGGLYNLIMAYDPEFWSGDQGYVDFPKSRFLEHTEAQIKNQFQSLNQNTIDIIKKLPTLFAIEEEKSDTRIGRITNIDIQPNNLRVYYKFKDGLNSLSRGALESPELGLNIDRAELYRTHWAIKEANIAEFYKRRSKSIEGLFDKIKTDLDRLNPDKPQNKNVSILYACNASGKTRLSKLFYEQYKGKVLYYNAFTEDLFSWDNERYVLTFDKTAWIFKTILDQGLEPEIVENFQKLTGAKLEPRFDLAIGEVVFSIKKGDDEGIENIKISRGEESVFIWSVFYTVLETAVDALNETNENRSTTDFNDITYIVIDDPVSSMDDTRIITIALDLAELISSANNQLKFLITTHHPLFFNVLFNAKKKNWNRNNYILSRSDFDFQLRPQTNESPFAYHHLIVSEIDKTIQCGDIRKFHFNLFRTLLEKTSNFLGYSHWKDCLQGDGQGKTLIKLIDHYSHSRLSALEASELSVGEKESFKEAFHFFMNEFKWGKNSHDQL